MREKPASQRPIRDPESAKRINSACDDSPHCPPLHSGRLTWLVNQFNKRGSGRTITVETARKWLSGESAPRKDKIALLALILDVDPTWIQTGEYGRNFALISKEAPSDIGVNRDLASPQENTIPIVIRPNVSVRVTGIPLDLNRAEAQKIANIILAHAVD